MYINYIPRNGILYATLTSSVRINGRVTKSKDSIYLGRVLDKERNIFQTRKDGVFMLNPKTWEKCPPPVDFVPSIKRKNAKDPELLLDFGDSYFFHEIMDRSGIDKLIEAIGYGNPDSLCGLLLFYMLSRQNNCHAENWWEGNFARVLFPNANLTSQRISDMLETIGTEATYQRFFKAYIPYIHKVSRKLGFPCKTNTTACGTASPAADDEDVDVPDHEGVLIDSTGLPNSVRFPLTAISNHNGTISEEVRLIYVTQRGTGLPLYMRYAPGNIIDASTLVTTMQELKASKIDTKFAILDAGYVTEENLRELQEAKISFLARLPENRKAFKTVMAQHGNSLERRENFVRYRERLLYIKRVKTTVVQGVEGYVYLGLDLTMRNQIYKQVGIRANADDMPCASVLDALDGAGTFCLVSSRPIAVDKILPLYYTRQDIEQVFDLGKNYGSMLPICTQKEETFRGHLLLTFLATVIQRQVQQEGKSKGVDLETLISVLRNQKCKVFPDSVIPQEAQKKQNEIYKAFKMRSPRCLTTAVEM